MTITNCADTIEYSAKEKRLIDEIRKVKFGQVVIFIQDYTPIRIEKVKESVVL